MHKENDLYNLTVDFGYYIKLHGGDDLFFNEIQGVRIIKKEREQGISEHICVTQHHGRFTAEDQQCEYYMMANKICLVID